MHAHGGGVREVGLLISTWPIGTSQQKHGCHPARLRTIRVDGNNPQGSRIIQFTKKLENVKSDERIIIYCVFSTSDHQFSMRFPNKNVLKTNLETDARICIPQISEK